MLDTIEEMIARLDEKLSAQVNEIMHAREFQQIESAWRGLTTWSINSETDATLKIRVMNVSKNELYRESARLSRTPSGTRARCSRSSTKPSSASSAASPMAAWSATITSTTLPTDVQLLRDLGKIAAAAHCPFIAGADPTLMGMDAWTELSNPRDLSKIFDTPDYAAWKSLRDSENSRYVGLCMPRVLARVPYGAKSEPVEEFAFEEETDGHKGEKYAWMNAAYAMAANINRAFKEYGWTRAHPRRAVGRRGDQPADPHLPDRRRRRRPEMPDRDRDQRPARGRAVEVRACIPLIHRKNTDKAAFIGAQSLYKPKTYDRAPRRPRPTTCRRASPTCSRCRASRTT